MTVNVVPDPFRLQAIKLALAYAVGSPASEGLAEDEPRPELGRRTARELLAIIHGYPVDYDDPRDVPSGSLSGATAKGLRWTGE